jgi:hypothetical protein
MDYEALLNLPDVTHLFETERGSKYAQHADATTTRNRSGAAHSDTTEGMQPRSGKTIYMNPTAAQNIAGIFQNAEMGTKLVPVMDAEGKPTGKAALDLIQDFGPKKAGTRLGTAPYSTTPAVGMVPVEIMNSQSPVGDSGRGVHFGTKITNVRPAGGGVSGGSGGADLKQILNPRAYKTGGLIDKPLEGNWKLI